MALDNSLFRGRLIKVCIRLRLPNAYPKPPGPQGYSETDECPRIQQRSWPWGLQRWLPRWLPRRWRRLSAISCSWKVRPLKVFNSLHKAHVRIAGGAVGDFKLQPQKYCHAQETLLLCIYAIPCTCHRIRLYITEQLINLNKVSGLE